MKKQLKSALAIALACASLISGSSALAVNTKTTNSTGSSATTGTILFTYDFSDYKLTPDLEILSALGIMGGYEDNSFRPDNPITRAEALKCVISLALPLALPLTVPHSEFLTPFNDISANDWHSAYWAVGKDMGIINGFEDGSARPNDLVTYAQIQKMLVTALGYSYNAENLGGYPNGFLSCAKQLKLTDNRSIYDMSAPAKRADVAQMLINAINAPIQIVSGYEADPTGMQTTTLAILDGTYVSEDKVKLPFTNILNSNGIYIVDATVKELKDQSAVIEIAKAANLDNKEITEPVTVTISTDDISLDNIKSCKLIIKGSAETGYSLVHLYSEFLEYK